MFTIVEIATATGGNIYGSREGFVTGVSTDSRKVAPGQLFVPLRGERFDGHGFISEVVSKGINVVLTEEQPPGEISADVTFITVPDTLRALGDLAAVHRRRFSLEVIGVTGSNGKTTAKEMLAAILEQDGPCLKTEGNLNNLIGLPLMLFKLNDTHRWAVLEMGMSEPGEIDRLAEIAAPQVGIVLNAFPAHLETMGNVENVAKAKGELLLRLPPFGCAVVNADDPLIAPLPSSKGARHLSFGLGDADVHATKIDSLGVLGQRLLLHIANATYSVDLHAFGRHSIYNALAAAAAAYAAGVAPEIICRGLETFRPYDKRFHLEEVADLVLIDDSYNANPASMGAALATLSDLKGDRRAFVALGDMLEMGSDQVELHRIIGVQAAQVADRLYLYGTLIASTADGAMSAGMAGTEIIHMQSHEEIVADILSRASQGDFVLVKGSRGMKMEKVAEGIRSSKL